MTKDVYFQKLRKLLRKLPEKDRETILSFYREIVEDKIENGIPEEEAVESLGDVGQLAQKILMENPQRRSGGVHPLVIILVCVLLGVVVLFGVVTTMGLVAYRNFQTTASVSKSMESQASPSSAVPSGTVSETNNGIPAGSSNVSGEERWTEEFRFAAADADEIEIDAENKEVIYETAEGDEVVILYDTDNMQIYTQQWEGRKFQLKNKDRRNTRQWGEAYRTDRPYRITVQVPAGYTGILKAETDNGRVEAKGFQKLTAFSCDTENGEVLLADMAVQRLEVDTENGQVELEHVQAAQQAEVDTENGQITLQEVAAPLLKMETENGMIQMKSVQASQSFQGKTENGFISFETLESPDILLKTSMGEISGSIRGNQADYRIITSKTMGENNLRSKSDGTKKLQATTDMGRIHITFDA